MENTADALYIGLMSGTSMDGIDAALVEFGQGPPQLLATHSEPIPPDLHEALTALARTPRSNGIDHLGAADVRLGRIFARAALPLIHQAAAQGRSVAAIGSHGQTIRHRPELAVPFTLQIGDPNTIAEMTGITTVADFRRRDMAAGGEGAPLVPAFHAAMFQDFLRPRAILNIGGIANITILPASAAVPVTGFDTGPGNTLLDAWNQRHRATPFDNGGAWAASGSVDQALLTRLLACGYLQRQPPKSTGPEYFNLAWLEKHIPGEQVPAADMQATLTRFTAASIAQAIRSYAGNVEEVLVCGGGVHNHTLMRTLKQALSPLSVDTTAPSGIHPDWVEATAFAWLARQTLSGRYGNLPAVTGAEHPVVLGGIYPGASS